MTAISVLVPIYNVEHYLTQCLESILQQTFQNFEVICINDGSTDNSLAIIKQFMLKDPRFKLINKLNTGYGHSMNQGLDQCQGEYVSIIESDDYVEPQMLERLYTIAKKNQLEVARCNYYKFSKFSKKINNDYISDISTGKVIEPIDNVQIFYQAPSIWVNLYNRNFLKNNNIRFLETAGASYQDTSFVYKVYALCKRFMFINEPLLYYRIDNAGSSINNKNKAFCVCDEYQEILKFTKEHPDIYIKLKYHLPVLRFNCYRWNFLRIDRKLRKLFLKSWQSDINDDYNEKRICKKTFGTKKMINLFLIKNIPYIYKMLKFFKN